MSKRETHKLPESELSDGDRAMIANARDILKRMGEAYDIDTPDPLTELGYEQRMTRARALEITCAAAPHLQATDRDLLDVADGFYHFIWEGKTDV